MIIGVGIMLLGAAKALFRFAKHELKHGRGDDELSIDSIRSYFGSYLLLGLEFSVAADIIETFLEPDKEHLIALGALVVIRTLISWFIGKERDEIRKLADHDASNPDTST